MLSKKLYSSLSVIVLIACQAQDPKSSKLSTTSEVTVCQEGELPTICRASYVDYNSKEYNFIFRGGTACDARETANEGLLLFGFSETSLAINCSEDLSGNFEKTIEFRSDFSNGNEGFQHEFADYHTDGSGFESYQFDGGLRDLPAEVGPGQSYYIQSNNRSDDVFMFLWKKLGPDSGITPNTKYLAEFNIKFASDSQSYCFGAGGAPGESVHLKAGLAKKAPRIEENDIGIFRLTSVDKGSQKQGGLEIGTTGDVANGQYCGEEKSFVSIERSYVHPFAIESNEIGELWVYIGTDSAFESLTKLYYQSVDLKISPL